MKMTKSTTINIPSGTVVGHMVKLLNTLPYDAKISMHTTKSDRPWESDSSSLEITWTEDL